MRLESFGRHVKRTLHRHVVVLFIVVNNVGIVVAVLLTCNTEETTFVQGGILVVPTITTICLHMIVSTIAAPVRSHQGLCFQLKQRILNHLELEVVLSPLSQRLKLLLCDLTVRDEKISLELICELLSSLFDLLEQLLQTMDVSTKILIRLLVPFL